MEKEEIINCPLRKALKALGGKWNLIIVKSINNEEKRFSVLYKQIPDISEKILIEKLKLLTKNDIVLRKDYKQVPPKVSYTLTNKGKKALEVVSIMENFGNLLPNAEE